MMGRQLSAVAFLNQVFIKIKSGLCLPTWRSHDQLHADVFLIAERHLLLRQTCLIKQQEADTSRFHSHREQ